MGKDEKAKKDNLNEEKTPETVTISKTEHMELTQKAQKADDYHDKWLRVHADFENTRKRLEKERLEFLRFANEDLILELLPIIDNFDRAIQSHPNADKEDLHLKGMVLIKDELHKLIENHGVIKIKSVGEKFNPDFHEAIAAVETDEHPEDMVMEETQAGYTMHDRLIRPAQVKVSKRKKIQK